MEGGYRYKVDGVPGQLHLGRDLALHAAGAPLESVSLPVPKEPNEATWWRWFQLAQDDAHRYRNQRVSV